MSILNLRFLQEKINREAPWATSHGSDEGDYIGAGLFYYSIVYMLKAKLCVCIGSGGAFVPRIMKQAQRDLGLTGARTILVDAIAGEWGRPQWTAPDSFFRREYPDVEIIFGKSHDVALNEGADWKIDYLHIDGDHTYEGSLQDFHDYKKLMAPDGLITFHDTYGEIPCYRTVADIRAEGHEVIDLREVGAGFALVKLKQDAAPMLEWKYLDSEAFRTRYVLAAHFLRECRTIIEIGGYKTPIDEFLTHDFESVLVLDPLVADPAAVDPRVRRIRQEYQQFDFSPYEGLDYGLVLIGFDFTPTEQLAALVRQAKVLVVEFAEDSSWTQSRNQFSELMLQAGRTAELQISLGYEGNDFGDLRGSWPPRTERKLLVSRRH